MVPDIQTGHAFFEPSPHYGYLDNGDSSYIPGKTASHFEVLFFAFTSRR